MERSSRGRSQPPARGADMASATIISRVGERTRNAVAERPGRPVDERAGIEAILQQRRTGENDDALGRLRWGLVALHEPLIRSLILYRLRNCPQSHGESVCDVAADQFYEYLSSDKLWRRVEAERMTTVKWAYRRIAGWRVSDHLRGRKPWVNDHPPDPKASPPVPGQAFGAGDGGSGDFDALLERTEVESGLAVPERELFDAEVEARLFQALGGPTTVDAVVVGLRLCEGLTYAQIASVLAGTEDGLSPAGLALVRRRIASCREPLGMPTANALKVRVHRALRRIDRHFDEEEPSQ